MRMGKYSSFEVSLLGEIRTPAFVQVPYHTILIPSGPWETLNSPDQIFIVLNLYSRWENKNSSSLPPGFCLQRALPIIKEAFLRI